MAENVAIRNKTFAFRPSELGLQLDKNALSRQIKVSKKLQT